jgi:hypothetical protein
MNLQEHIRRILKEETYELPKRTSLENEITKFVEDELEEYDLPSNFYGVAVDIIDNNEVCTITALFKKSYKMDDSDRLHAIMKKIIKECEDFFGGSMRFKYDGTSTIENYIQIYSNYYQSKKRTPRDKGNVNEMNLRDRFKSMFGKKPLTKDDKLINAIAKFIDESYLLDSDSNDFGEVTFYLVDSRGNRTYPPVMKYFPSHKVLHYSWDFAKDIHNWIGDNRLLQLDSEMIGKIFTKLFNKKIDTVFGYSEL